MKIAAACKREQNAVVQQATFAFFSIFSAISMMIYWWEFIWRLQKLEKQELLIENAGN